MRKSEIGEQCNHQSSVIKGPHGFYSMTEGGNTFKYKVQSKTFYFFSGEWGGGGEVLLPQGWSGIQCKLC